jgi:hypothetical protein
MPRLQQPKELVISDDPKTNARLMQLKQEIRKHGSKGTQIFLELGRCFSEAYVALGGNKTHVLSGRKRLTHVTQTLQPDDPVTVTQSPTTEFEQQVDRKVDARFRQWASDLPYSPSSVERFMRAHILRETKLAALEAQQLALIDQTVFYDLSKNGTSDAVIQRVVERAQANQPVKRKDLKEQKKAVKRRAKLTPPADPDKQDESDAPADHDVVEADATVVKADEVTEAHAVHDALGDTLPERLVPVFDTAAELEGIHNRINAERLALQKLLATREVTVLGAPAGRESVHAGAAMLINTGTLEALKTASRNLKEYRPHAICPTCKGKGCEKESPRKFFCGGRGWTTTGEWKRIQEVLGKG